MKNLKKIVFLALVVVAVLAIALPASAGSIVTPNGGRTYLYTKSTSPAGEYVAYVSSGASASLAGGGTANGRTHVTAYGYNSQTPPVYKNYTGWVNSAYYFA